VQVPCKLGKFGLRTPQQVSAALVAAEPLDGCMQPSVDMQGKIGQDPDLVPCRTVLTCEFCQR
jgi:hypothetical protein